MVLPIFCIYAIYFALQMPLLRDIIYKKEIFYGTFGFFVWQFR